MNNLIIILIVIFIFWLFFSSTKENTDFETGGSFIHDQSNPIENGSTTI